MGVALLVKSGTAVRVKKAEAPFRDLRNHVTSRDNLFFAEDIAIDPLGRVGVGPNDEFQQGAGYARQGYYGFKRDGWLLLVHTSKVVTDPQESVRPVSGGSGESVPAEPQLCSRCGQRPGRNWRFGDWARWGKASFTEAFVCSACAHEIEKVRQYGCCDEARVMSCWCVVATTCDVHGERHHGSHD